MPSTKHAFAMTFVVAAISGCWVSPIPRCTTDAECLVRAGGVPAYCHATLRYCFYYDSLDASVADASTPDAGDGGCVEAVDCTGNDTDCRTRTCSFGVCGFAVADSGIALTSQTMGDCRLAVCDGDGGTTHRPLNSDPPLNSNLCIDATCNAGVVTMTYQAPGFPCDAGTCSSGVCGCFAAFCPGTDTECATRACVGGACSFTFSDAGVPLSAQSAGDCRRLECDGDGGVTDAIFNSDLPPNVFACADPRCENGFFGYLNKFDGTTCDGGTCSNGQCL